MWLVLAVGHTAGWVLYLLLLWRCHKERHWGRYPFFCTYLVFAVLRLAAIEIFATKNYSFFPWFYWYSDLISVLLRFCIAWEVLRHTFPAGTVLRGIATRILLVLSMILAPAFYFLVEPQGNFFLDLERKLGLAVVAWLVVLLLLARFYGVSMSRNIWGMAVGLGFYVSFSIADFSAFDLKSPLYYAGLILTPYGFVVMLFIWTWALWSYAPAPQLQPVSEPSLHAAQAGWRRSWRRMVSAIRNSLGR
jgi:hypothetical protein